MGLDSGLLIHSDKRKLTREDLPTGISYPFEKDYDYDIELVYFRKCWNIRNHIMNHFGWLLAPENQWKFIIDKPEQVLELIEIFAYWLNEEVWEEDGSSIWSYQEIRPQLIQSIINTAIIYSWLINNPDCYLIWYDSY